MASCTVFIAQDAGGPELDIPQAYEAAAGREHPRDLSAACRPAASAAVLLS